MNQGELRNRRLQNRLRATGGSERWEIVVAKDRQA
jgi:hypothetical protein